MNTTLGCVDSRAYRSQSDRSDEQELIALARTRDHVAIALLFTRFHDSAVGFAYQRLGNRDDAEDAVQTAWTRAINRLDQFRGTAKFSTWLFTIVLNECRSHQKRSRGRRNTSLDFAIDLGNSEILNAVAVPSTMDMEYESRQLETRLRQYIGRMPAVYRRILWLRYVIGLPLQQVAARLSISTPAAKSRIMRARVELRSAFQQKSTNALAE